MNSQKGLALSEQNESKGFSLIIILLITAVVIIGGGIAVFLYLTSTTNPSLGSSAYTPSELDITIPKPDSSSGFRLPAEPATPAANPLPTTSIPVAPPPTTTRTPETPIGQIDTVTTLSSDAKTFTIKFESSSNFQTINSITYNLTYLAGGNQKSITGTFAVSGSTLGLDANGKKYIQKDLTLATCSSGTCVYDTNPTGFRLSVTTH